jgi:hypothetical protein
VKRWSIVWAMALAAAGCGEQRTGVHVTAKMGALAYDELRFDVRLTGGDGRVLVDPETRGRFLAPFSPGDQDLFVYVAEEIAGNEIRCKVTALAAGKDIARAEAEALVVRQKIADVVVVLGSGPGTDVDAGPMPPPGDPPDPADAGTMPPPATNRANGQACSRKEECASDHCADGICCESACDTSCRSCALSGSLGLCRPVPAGSPDPRALCLDEGVGKCKTNGLCDVSGHCAQYPAGTPCAAAGCENSGEEVVGAGFCDGAGKCEIPQKMKCPGGMRCAAGICM